MELKRQIELLTQLGLATNQAKIYLACANYKSSTVKQIAQSTNLANEVVYRTMPKLQKMGLVSKTLAFPTEYQATPVESAITTLLEQRRKESIQVQKKAKELLRHMAKRKTGKHNEENRIVLIPEKERQIQFTKDRIRTARKSIHVIGMEQKFYAWINAYQEVIKELLDKNINVRFIFAGTEERVDEQTLIGIPKDSDFKTKYITYKIPTGLTLIDDKEVLIDTMPESGFAHRAVYWSNDPGIVAPCEAYFEKYWK